jgi:hypothetical protein
MEVVFFTLNRKRIRNIRKQGIMRVTEDLIKGLESGFFRSYIDGYADERKKVFKDSFKQYVDAGKFSKYVCKRSGSYGCDKDLYIKEGIDVKHTIDYYMLSFHIKVLKTINIDYRFSFQKELYENKSEYTYGDFTIGYKDYSYMFWNCLQKKNILTHSSGYYFKYKGQINNLMFAASPELVDYSSDLYSREKGVSQYYFDVEKLLHNMRYYITYNNLKY